MPIEFWIRQFAGILLTVIYVAIFVRILLSWFPIDPNNGLVRFLFDITEPVLAPFRRVIPTIGMFDLSPLAALIVLSLLASALGVRLMF